jgi:uncharacterized protein
LQNQCPAILDFLFYRGTSGANVVRGIEGYGASTLIHRSHLLWFSSDAPIMVSVIDSEEKVSGMSPV